MELGSAYIVYTLVLLQFLAQFCPLIMGNRNLSYVHDACSVTRYPDICVHSLASYSDRAKRSPTKWAQAGISVSINGAKNMSRFLIGLKANNTMRGRNRVALLDCIECFEDLIYDLRKSLRVLRKLKKHEFFEQIGDVTTWVSTALTDEDTCLDGFDDRMGKEINFVCDKVMNMSYITSNALALVNKLANSGPQSLKV